MYKRQRQKRTKPTLLSNPSSPRPTRFTLVREQCQPAGEFQQYIQDAQSDSFDFRTADESPSDSMPESARPRQDSGGAAAVMHDTASAIQGTQERNQRPRVLPAGAESPGTILTSGSDNDDPDVSLPNFPGSRDNKPDS